jgi:hypothetical protein
MMTNRCAFGVLLFAALITAAATGCAGVEGKPTMAPTLSPAETTTSEAASPSPTGQPVGTATMKVSGVGPVTIRYQINGGAEQVESDVALPWEMQYLVYDEIVTSVTADGGDAELTCSIIMDGMLAALKTEPRPTCSFAYYG